MRLKRPQINLRGQIGYLLPGIIDIIKPESGHDTLINKPTGNLRIDTRIQFLNISCNWLHQRSHTKITLSLVLIVCNYLYGQIWGDVATVLDIIGWGYHDCQFAAGVAVWDLEDYVLFCAVEVTVHCCEMPSCVYCQLHLHALEVSCPQQIVYIVVKLIELRSRIFGIDLHLRIGKLEHITNNLQILIISTKSKKSKGTLLIDNLIPILDHKSFITALKKTGTFHSIWLDGWLIGPLLHRLFFEHLFSDYGFVALEDEEFGGGVFQS